MMKTGKRVSMKVILAPKGPGQMGGSMKGKIKN